MRKRLVIRGLLLSLLLLRCVTGEVMVQYFNTTWRELAEKMPELAEAGYESIWAPPPTKGSGGLSVGYDLFDRFDLGGVDQRGSVSTRYGTQGDLIEMVKVAHRFGIRVYFDNIMNHNAFDVPGFNAGVPIDIYPGFVPEDFHLRVTEEGFYRKWDNTRNWGDEWQVQNLGLSDLIDIATEPGEWNRNFGSFEGAQIKKISFVRHPNDPGYYCYKPTGAGQKHARGEGEYVGFGAGNGITVADLVAEQAFYSEYVEDLLSRAARWQMDVTKADGLRLDAVKHTPADFYGATYGADKDTSDYGYSGQVQRQFNLTRGFSDANHRDTVFNTEQARDDAMLFGEHLGQPPSYQAYVDSGMRLVDNDLRNQLNNRLGNPSSDLSGYDQPGWGGFHQNVAVMHAQSHDNDFAARRELQHAFYFTREGLPLVYTDGNYHAETLSQSGGAFPRHANTNFLGQFNDGRLPNLAYIHQHFARGYQVGKWSDADFVAYERIDKRENGGMTDADGVTALIMLNDNYSSGEARSLSTSFPSVAGTSGDAYLWQYASGPGLGGFYTYASNLNTHTVPSGGYFVFSWRTPEESSPWSAAGGEPVTIYEGGTEAGRMTVVRKDGPDGDPGFNPNGLPDADATDYSYEVEIPRVTSGTDLRFVVRADGSAENVLLKLDGGIDLNGTSGHSDPGLRDYPPAVSTDVFIGYEQGTFVKRQAAEKFAAKDTGRCQIGSVGAETYVTTVGSGSFTINNGSGTNPTPNQTAAFLYHDPEVAVESPPVGSPNHYEEASGSVTLWAKAPSGLSGYELSIYYTVDGSFPEGYGGEGTGTTKVAPMSWSHDAGGGSWFSGAITPQPSGELRYKISIARTNDGVSPLASVFPTGPGKVDEKLGMMTVFEVDGFDATTAQFFPHNDYQKTPDQNSFVTQTGLDEGMHMIRGRAFLNRSGKASLYNTFQQTFYYDTRRPEGEIVFPAEGAVLGGQNYGAVVRTDRSVDEVWFFIDDGVGPNDDSETGTTNGNGVGQWVQAYEVNPTAAITSSYPKEWRFDYTNIPSGSAPAVLQVRLVEKSSAEESTFTGTVSAADDVTNWYTTLTRNLVADGPNTQVFVAFPAMDGEVVGEDYVMKVYFSKSLGDGVSDENLIEEFLIKIGSRQSGSPDGAISQDRSLYSIIRNETADYHALAYNLPNLYNGDPDFLHHIGITHERGGVTLVANRLVKAAVVERTFLSITTPPAFDSDGKPHEVVLPATTTPTPDLRTVPIIVETDTEVVELDFNWELGSGTMNLISSTVSGSQKIWVYEWTNVNEGNYRFRVDARNSVGGPIEETERRDVVVIFRQILPEEENDPDDDDDGLLDDNEATPVDLPDTNPETWLNGEVHVWRAYGNSNPQTPDTDGDLLPDALELGWGGVPASQVGEEFQDVGYGSSNLGAGNFLYDWDDANGNGIPDVGEASEPFTDTDGDGIFDYGTILTRDLDGDGTPNFKADLDPPYFNTVPDNNGLPNYDFNRGRTEQIHGTMTNPQNPDSDGDGIIDGREDSYNPAWASGLDFPVMIHNGWVDGDGNSLGAYDPGKVWPDGVMDSGERWLETDPNNPDSDGDGLSDGYGEDLDGDGLITGDANRNRSYDAGEAWLETDALSKDTDGDGLLDGWEAQNGLDPLDDGSDNLSTAAPGDGDPEQGASGDPDGDGFPNSQEQTSGTKPLVSDLTTTPPANSIVIGPGEAVTVGALTNGNEFEGWLCSDVVAYDEYEGEGANNQGGDIFPGGDGFDSSRDIVAFYARDGGADGTYYFRIDFKDLQAFAEEGNLDAYVVIDTGNPESGEASLPDEVDTYTEMKWEVVVACYHSNVGRVHVDTNAAINTTGVNENLLATGVEVRDQNSANGFKDAYFNSDLDAVEFSISRQALLDAGWNGASDLRFQVYTTRDGTRNDGTGVGDLGGRNDIRDTIYDDWISEDYWSAQDYIADNGRLSSYMQTDANGRYPDECKKAKLILLHHANDPILPGSRLQESINSGFGTGWHRALDTHEAFALPMTLHLTTTVASAIEWAAVDPAAGKPWLDGPAFNDRIGSGMVNGAVELLGSSFSDHIPSYFSSDYNEDNAELATESLERIYGSAPSARTYWIPERVADADVFGKVLGMGYTHAFVDQMRHLWKWEGRGTAISDDGYRLNKYHGVTCFMINDQASSYRFQTSNQGLPTALRNLFHRKARSGIQDQAVVMYHHWNEFAVAENAEAYDTNMRWVASKPWIEVVTPEAIASGQVDVTGDGVGDQWYVIDRGGPTIAKTSHDWLDHATQENYDDWYLGKAGSEEGLQGRFFELRPGVSLPWAFGMEASGDGLLADAAWSEVAAMSSTATGLGRLARGTAHAATYLTAYHEQQNNDLSKYSTGAYIWPDSDYNVLSDFAKNAQSRMRHAAVYKEVELWAANLPLAAEAISMDVDLDGEDEYVLRNDRVFAVFEATGGRMTAGWVRDEVTGRVYQVVGNYLSYVNRETEHEGASVLSNGEIEAYRTSAFKDWFAEGPNTNLYVNDSYSVSLSGTNGWDFTSSDGKIVKVVSLATGSTRLSADYTLAGDVSRLFVRFGLSPDLDELLVAGQKNLVGATDDGTAVSVKNVSATAAVEAAVYYSGAIYNVSATDQVPSVFEPDTVMMRNQAQTEQVEMQSTSSNFTLELAMEVECEDCDGDGLPDAWETTNGISPTDDGSVDIHNGADGDPDGDGLTNIFEYLLGLDPQVVNLEQQPCLMAIPNADGSVTLEFPTIPDRKYRLWWSDDLEGWTQLGSEIITIGESANPARQVIDEGMPDTQTHPSTEPKRFYQLEITFP